MSSFGAVRMSVDSIKNIGLVEEFAPVIGLFRSPPGGLSGRSEKRSAGRPGWEEFYCRLVEKFLSF